MGVVAWLAGAGVYTLAGGVFVGILIPALASFLRPAMVWAIAALLVLSLVRMNLHAVAAISRRPILVLYLVVLLLFVSPLLIWTLSGFTQPPTSLWLAIILMACAAPITSSPAMVALVGLDADLSLVILIVTTFLAPFTIALVAFVTGMELTISSLDLFIRLGIFVGGCAIVALILRRLIGVEQSQRLKNHFDVASVLFLLVFAIAIMDGVGVRIMQQPEHVLWVTLVAFVANFGLLIVGTLASSWLGLRSALTVGFSVANCNMGTLWAVLPPDTDSDVFLYFAVAQIPMYISPVILRRVWRTEAV